MKWQRVQLSQRSASQHHFLDLCELLEQPKPAAADPDGTFCTFERGVKRIPARRDWADVWMRGHFAWEYKGKHKDLAAAYQQLLLYREDLENPPLLVVCDSGPLRGTHELHRPGEAGLPVPARGPARPIEPRRAEPALHRMESLRPYHGIAPERAKSDSIASSCGDAEYIVSFGGGSGESIAGTLASSHIATAGVRFDGSFTRRRPPATVWKLGSVPTPVRQYGARAGLPCLR